MPTLEAAGRAVIEAAERYNEPEARAAVAEMKDALGAAPPLDLARRALAALREPRYFDLISTSALRFATARSTIPGRCGS